MSNPNQNLAFLRTIKKILDKYEINLDYKFRSHINLNPEGFRILYKYEKEAVKNIYSHDKVLSHQENEIFRNEWEYFVPFRNDYTEVLDRFSKDLKRNLINESTKISLWEQSEYQYEVCDDIY